MERLSQRARAHGPRPPGRAGDGAVRGEDLRTLADVVKRTVDLVRFAEEAGGVEWDAKFRGPRGARMGLCPLHQEATPSFHVEPAKRLWHCFGCQQGGDVITLAAALWTCSKPEAIRRLARERGLVVADPAEAERRREARAAERARRDAAEARDEARKRRIAGDLWAQAKHAGRARHILERYLLARCGEEAGIAMLELWGLRPPPTLRLDEECVHWLRGASGRLEEAFRGPAMIARVGRDAFQGIHRTWITEAGRARWPDPAPPGCVPGDKIEKLMLGGCHGHPVPLSPPLPDGPAPERMLVAEGIETTLAGLGLLAADGRVVRERWGAEAALALGPLAGLAHPSSPRGPRSRATGRRLPAVEPHPSGEGWWPPEGVRVVRLLAEGSSKCPETAARLTERARRRLEGGGLIVEVRLPASGWGGGADFADVAKGGRR